MKYLLIFVCIAFICLIVLFIPNIYFKENDVKIYNEKNELIDGMIYKNHRTIDFQKTKEYIVCFNRGVSNSFITIAVPPKLIGIPDNSNNIKKILNILYVPNESKIFTSINEGPVANYITDFYVSDSLFYFNSFGNMSSFGKKIIVKFK